MKIKANKNTLLRVLGYAEKHKYRVLLLLILAAVYVYFTLRIPVIIGDAIDLIVENITDVQFAEIRSILISVVVCAVISAFCRLMTDRIANRIVCETVNDVRKEAFLKLQSLPVSYLDSHPSGDTLSRIISDADTFADGLLLGFSTLFIGVCTILGTLYSMIRLNVFVAIVVVITTPLSFLAASFISKNTHSLFAKQAKQRGVESAFLNETIQGQKIVKAYSAEEKRIRDFDEIDKILTDYNDRGTFFSSLVNPTTRVINANIYAAVVLVGGFSCISGSYGMTVGNLSSMLSYASQFGKPFNDVSEVMTELTNALQCAERLFELIDQPSEKPDAPDAKVLENADGKIELQNIEFSYTEGPSLIKNISFTAELGQHIAIVGPTGCGKTTVINMLLRFYDPRSGVISLDGNDISTVTRKSLRHNYGMVLQDTWLKNGTVKENIKLGFPDALDEDVVKAAKTAHADSFIRHLPKGYDTVLDENGGILSEGQKQLLCITRILLSPPPVLILDEATSSIDTRTEQKVQAAIDLLMEGRTSIIVAHRLSTIRKADKIIAIKDGHIIEEGNHEELIAKHGFYYDLYESQFREA